MVLNRVTRPRPKFMIDSIKAWKITRVTVSSTVLASIVELIEKSVDHLTVQQQLSTIKVWVCCGDTLTFELAERFFAALGSRQLMVSRSASRKDLASKPEVPVENHGVASGDSSTVSLTRRADSERKFLPPIIKMNQAKLVHLYGTTETTADAAYEIFEDLDDLLGKSNRYKLPYGLPIANTLIYISHDFHLQSLDTIGEICVSGSCLCRSYIARVDDMDFIESHTAKNNQGKYCRKFIFFECVN